jgi:hypothetical protein
LLAVRIASAGPYHAWATPLKFGEHGTVERILSSAGGESDAVVYTFERQGMDMDQFGTQLQ